VVRNHSAVKSVTDVSLGLLSRCSVSGDAGAGALVSCGAAPLIIAALESAATLATSDPNAGAAASEAAEGEGTSSALVTSDSGVVLHLCGRGRGWRRGSGDSGGGGESVVSLCSHQGAVWCPMSLLPFSEVIAQHALIALEGVSRVTPGRDLLRKLNAIEVVVKAAGLAVTQQSRDAVSKLLSLLPLQQDVQNSIVKLGEVCSAS
jgi:hypothetical protein